MKIICQILILLFLIACNSKDAPFEQNEYASFIRILSFNYNSLDENYLKIELNSKILSDSIYWFKSTGFIKTNIDSNNITVYSGENKNILFSNYYILEDNKYYSLYFYKNDTTMTTHWIEDNISIDLDVCQICIFHSSSKRSIVDIKLINESDSCFYQNLAFEDLSEVKTILSGQYNLYIKPYEYGFYAKYITNINLYGGHSYTFIISDKFHSVWYPYIMFIIDNTDESQEFVNIN